MKNKSHTFIWASLMAGTALTPCLALADASGAEGVIEEIVVTGERVRMRDAIGARHNALAIVDSVGQDDMGRLPDMNVSDTFRRLPGASAVADEDEGRFVTVRGLRPELNYVTLDGLAVATHDAFGGGGRGVNLEVIPNSAVKRLEVYKTFTSNIDGHAVGGYLNLVTRSPFDAEGFSVAADASIARYTLRALPTSTNHDPEGKASVTLSDTFGDGKYGWLLSASYDRKARDETKIIPDGYSYFNASGTSTASPLVGNGYAVPNQYRFFMYDDELERMGSLAKFEARISDALNTGISGYFYRQENAENRYGHHILSLTGLSNQTSDTGTFARGVGETTYSFFPIKRRSAGVNWKTDYTPNTDHHVGATFGYSFSDFTHDTPNLQFRTPSAAGLGVQYNTSNFIPSFTVNDPNYWLNPANYTLFQLDYRQLRTDEGIYEGKVDYDFNAEQNDVGWGVIAGAGWRQLTREVNNEQQFYTNPTLTLTGLLQNENYTPPGRNVPYMFFDYDRFASLFQSQRANFTQNTVSSFENSMSADFRYVEDIYSAHAGARFATEQLKLIAGLRYERVNVSGQTYRRLTQPTPDVFTPVPLDSSYEHVLPSLNVSWDWTSQFRTRFAVSRSVGRPNPSDIAQQQSISTDGLTITRGNPDLKPRKSNNYDVAFEYMFDDGNSFVSVTPFHKDIKGDIFSARSTEIFEGRTVSVVQPVNSSKSKVSGLELGFTKSAFDFLPQPFDGFGVSANATFLDGSFDYLNAAGQIETFDRLIQQSERLYNATLFYAWPEGSELRLAYNYTGDNFSSVNTTSPWLSRGTPSAKQWDLTGRYHLDDQWTLRFEARNLTNEDQYIVEGTGLNRLIEQVDYGRSFWIGFSFRN
jgi:TonB-dependent receptor